MKIPVFTKLLNALGLTINPATEEKQDSSLALQQSTDDSIVFLKRIVKLLESSAVVDSNMRQRIAVENLTVSIAGTNSGAGVAGANLPTANAPTQNPSGQGFIPVWSGPVDPRYQTIEQARTSYAVGIRSNLIFT
jgi:hypothetical protein